MAERVKTLVLKRAIFPDGESVTLEELLTAIFAKTSHPKQRIVELDLIKRAVVGSKDFGPKNNGIFVRIFEFEAGAFGSINFDAADGLADIEGVDPPKGQSFLHEDIGLLVMGNDIIACGMSNKNRTYSHALCDLAARCGAGAQGLRLELTDVPNTTNLNDLKQTGVREISLGVSDYLASLPEDSTLHNRILSAIFAKPSEASDIKKREAVTGRLSLSRGRFGKEEIKVDPWLTSVGKEIVETDTDQDYTIVLEDERRLTSNNLKMIKRVKVKRHFNTVNYAELKSHMSEFYAELTRAGIL